MKAQTDADTAKRKSTALALAHHTPSTQNTQSAPNTQSSQKRERRQGQRTRSIGLALVRIRIRERVTETDTQRETEGRERHSRTISHLLIRRSAHTRILTQIHALTRAPAQTARAVANTAAKRHNAHIRVWALMTTTTSMRLLSGLALRKKKKPRKATRTLACVLARTLTCRCLTPSRLLARTRNHNTHRANQQQQQQQQPQQNPSRARDRH